jgi:predicted transcriptional regulator of viral defense system
MPKVKLPGLLRPRDLAEYGIPRGRLKGMLVREEVERVGRGLYRLRGAPLDELETIAAVSKRVPKAIVCLLTALHVHGIGTQAPRDVWIALDRKARKPRTPDLPVRLVRFSGPMLRYGIETREVLGVRVRLTSPARTVVDCFRYRNKIGLDVALEALREAWRARRFTMDDIDRYARICRVARVMRPYLEGLVA